MFPFFSLSCTNGGADYDESIVPRKLLFLDKRFNSGLTVYVLKTNVHYFLDSQFYALDWLNDGSVFYPQYVHTSIPTYLIYDDSWDSMMEQSGSRFLFANAKTKAQIQAYSVEEVTTFQRKLTKQLVYYLGLANDMQPTKFTTVPLGLKTNPNDKSDGQSYSVEVDVPPELGDANFPVTEGMHAAFYDGHTFYIPNGLTPNESLTRRLKEKMSEMGLLFNQGVLGGVHISGQPERTMYIVLQSAIPFEGNIIGGHSYYLLPTYMFVAYGRKADYPKPYTFDFLTLSNDINKAKGVDLWIATKGKYRNGLIISSTAMASEIGIKMDKYAVVGQTYRDLT